MRNPWASMEGAVRRGPNGLEPPFSLTLRYTGRTQKLRASLLQLLNKGSDYFLFNFL